MAEKKGNGTRSDRERIKNITDLVHPDDKPAKENTHRNSNKRPGGKVTGAGQRKHSKDHNKSNNSAHTRHRLSVFARVAAAVIIITVLAFAIVMVRNFNTGSRHDDKGMTAYDAGDYDKAVKEFKEAVSYDDKNAQYYIHLGMAYIEQKSYDEALGYFTQAEACAETDSDKILTCRGRGIAYLYSGSYQDAVDSFENALSYSGDSLSRDIQKDILYYEAQSYESMSDYSSARDVYSRILDISGDDAMALMKRGLACEKLEDYTGAESDLRAAINKSKKSYTIYKALYEALQQQGKTEEASQTLDEALELSGDSGEDYFCRGMIYLEKNDTDSAADMFQKSYDKGYTAALIGQGSIAYDNEDYESAASDYEKFFSETGPGSTDPDLNAAAYDQYALCLLKLGRYDDAVTACRNGLDLGSLDNDAALSFNLIVAYEDLQQWENAYSEAKTYHEKYPDDEKGTHEFIFLESRMQK